MLNPINRRRCLGLAASASFLFLPLGAAFAQAQAAAEFVRNLGSQLVQVVNEPGDASSKREQLRPILDQNIAVDQIALFCLGRYQRDATPAQLADYEQLFHNVLLNSILGHLGSYRGVRFEMGQTSEQPDGAHVETTIYRPNEEPAMVDWVISQAGGHRQVIDVVAEGTSLRTTQRGDYTSYLDRHAGSIEALLMALKRQVAKQSSSG